MLQESCFAKKQNKRAYDFFDNIATKYINQNDEEKI